MLDSSCGIFSNYCTRPDWHLNSHIRTLTQPWLRFTLSTDPSHHQPTFMPQTRRLAGWQTERASGGRRCMFYSLSFYPPSVYSVIHRCDYLSPSPLELPVIPDDDDDDESLTLSESTEGVSHIIKHCWTFTHFVPDDEAFRDFYLWKSPRLIIATDVIPTSVFLCKFNTVQ